MENPKHILITGASSGIGAALAELYAGPDIRLSLHGRNRARLDEVAKQAQEKGAFVIQQIGNVTDAGALAEWIKSSDALQPVDLVIANAGISAGTFGGGESNAQVGAIFATNWTGVLNTIEPLIPLMKQRKRGQIALVSSLAGFRGHAGAPAYCASKAAVRVYGEALRGELMPYGIEVNVICPGFIKTPMTDVNHFPMPFIMPVEKAAAIIRGALTRNKARIAFPWPMYAGVQLLSILPQNALDRLMRKMPKKGG